MQRVKVPSAMEFTLILDWIANAETFDAWEELSEMIEDQPEEAWRFVRNMIDLAPTARLACVIAAGPLEDLLSKHSEMFGARMEDSARSDLRFHEALKGVWLSDPEWLAARMKAVLAEVPAGNAALPRVELSREDYRFISRWFHHADTMWAVTYINELVRTDADEAW